MTLAEWHLLREDNLRGLVSDHYLTERVMESGSDGTFEMDAVVSALKEVA